MLSKLRGYHFKNHHRHHSFQMTLCFCMQIVCVCVSIFAVQSVIKTAYIATFCCMRKNEENPNRSSNKQQKPQKVCRVNNSFLFFSFLNQNQDCLGFVLGLFGWFLIGIWICTNELKGFCLVTNVRPKAIGSWSASCNLALHNLQPCWKSYQPGQRKFVQLAPSDHWQILH